MAGDSDDFGIETVEGVRPRGTFGEAYMALIKPFRHWIVYPTLMRQMERAWNAQAA